MMRTNSIARSLVAALMASVLVFGVAASARAATITIVNNDGAGEGFNDPTPAAPVGGNPGTTVGAQRLNVFQYAANLWGSILPSGVVIVVNATFDPLTCTATSAVLGSAGPTTVHANFTGAPLANRWYHQALANRLNGTDLNPGQADITARFNSSLNGSATCLGGSGWYLGFDGLEGTNVELLPVVLHELGHGLGFSTTTSGTTGNYLGTSPNQFPHVFDHFLYDGINNLHWDQNTPAQRVASAISVDKLSWDGPAVSYGAPAYLNKRARLVVNSPGGIAGNYAANAAAFGAALTVAGVTGNVVLADDGVAPGSDGCSALVNAGAIAGNIALIDRGTCTFVVKAQAAQAAGAIALIIANNAAGALAPGGADPSITIPVIGITQADGNTLKANLGGGVNVKIGLDPTLLAGADTGGRPLMYAPNPFQSGSSVSHYDVTLTPNALMEPAINVDLHDAVDLTKHAFVDEGWLDFATATTLAMFTAEDRAGGILLTWEFTDPSDIGVLSVERADAETGPWEPVSVDLTLQAGRTSGLDASVQPEQTYYYRLRVTDRAGASSIYGLVAGRHASSVSGPAVLMAPRPNPTAGSATIAFRLARPEFVRVTLVDATGRTVRTLQQGMLAPGEHARIWDGRSDGNRDVPAGLYFVVLQTSEGRRAQRMAIVR